MFSPNSFKCRESLEYLSSVNSTYYTLMDSVDHFIVVMVCFDSFFIHHHELFEKNEKEESTSY
jgi:hypothetical protein